MAVSEQIAKAQMTRFAEHPFPVKSPDGIRERVWVLMRSADDARHAKCAGDWLMLNVDHYPTPAEVYRACAETAAAPETALDKLAKPIGKPDCPHCNGAGFVARTVMYRGAPIEAVKPCTCRGKIPDAPIPPKKQANGDLARGKVKQADVDAAIRKGGAA